MAQLLVRDVSSDLVAKLKTRAADHGVSIDEELRRILQEALGQPTTTPKKEYTFLDHIRKLAEVAPDIDFEYDRSRSRHRDFEF
jgi:plasmid stability protein